MKQIKKTGSWGGDDIWREETAEETIQRELGEGKDKVANIFINIEENL